MNLEHQALIKNCNEKIQNTINDYSHSKMAQFFLFYKLLETLHDVDILTTITNTTTLHANSLIAVFQTEVADRMREKK